MAKDQEIASYVAERDAALNAGFGEFLAFATKEGINLSRPEVAEIAFHKCRTASTGVRQELRDASRLWLRDGGYRSLE